MAPASTASLRVLDWELRSYLKIQTDRVVMQLTNIWKTLKEMEKRDADRPLGTKLSQLYVFVTDPAVPSSDWPSRRVV